MAVVDGERRTAFVAGEMASISKLRVVERQRPQHLPLIDPLKLPLLFACPVRMTCQRVAIPFARSLRAEPHG